jgi:hypothetical protein
VILEDRPVATEAEDKAEAASGQRTPTPDPERRCDLEDGYAIEDETSLCVEQEGLVPVYAVKQPHSSLRSVESSQDEVNQHDRRAVTCGSLEEAQCNSPLNTPNKERMDGGEDEVGAKRDMPPKEVREEEELQQQQQEGGGKEVSISYDIGKFGDDCSPVTSDEDDENPRPAKRRRRHPTNLKTTRMPTRGHSPSPSLRQRRSQSPPATQDEASLTHVRDKHRRSPYSTDDSNSRSPYTSQSPSSTANPILAAAAAEYHEWGLQNGSLKRTTIGDETIFQLEFSLKDLRSLLAQQVPSNVSGDGPRMRASARTTGSHRSTNHIKTKAPVQWRGGKYGAFTTEDDEHLINLKENQCLRWKDIAKEFPGESANTLQVRYCTKLKNRRVGSKDGSDSVE